MSNHIISQELVVNEAENQFELQLDGGKAVVEYVLTGDKINLVHTEVPKEFAGKGIAAILVKKVLEYIKVKNWILTPSCSYVAKFVDNHPEYHSILSEGYQM